MKKCPFCAEEIQDGALKCRFCGEFLKKKNKWLSCLSGCLIFLAVSSLLTILTVYLGIILIKTMVYKSLLGEQPLLFPPGLDYMLRDFSEFWRSFWLKILELFNQGSPNIV